jgi:hypothetical protein
MRLVNRGRYDKLHQRVGALELDGFTKNAKTLEQPRRSFSRIVLLSRISDPVLMT